MKKLLLVSLLLSQLLPVGAFAGDCQPGFQASAPMDPITASPLTTANQVAKVASESDPIPDGSQTYSCVDTNGRNHTAVLTKHSKAMTLVVDDEGPYVEPPCYTVYDKTCPRSLDPVPASMDPFDAYAHFHLQSAPKKDLLVFVSGQYKVKQLFFPLADGTQLATRYCTTNLTPTN